MIAAHTAAQDAGPTVWVANVWDFESGDLSGWNIVDTAESDNAVFTTAGNMPTQLPATGYDDSTVQGEYFIRTWDASTLAGETVRLRIYDTSSGSWGHIDVDNIRLIAEIVDPIAASLSFDSSEAATVADRPTLTVVYTRPVLPGGDTNDDGNVDRRDVVTLLRNLGTAINAGPSGGDFTGDGMTGIADLALMQSNFGIVTPSAQAPSRESDAAAAAALITTAPPDPSFANVSSSKFRPIHAVPN